VAFLEPSSIISYPFENSLPVKKTFNFVLGTFKQKLFLKKTKSFYMRTALRPLFATGAETSYFGMENVKKCNSMKTPMMPLRCGILY
jgi:NADH dehydrogenase